MQIKLPKIHVDPDTGHFVDPAGRVRIFHGLNSVEKQPPWYEINMRNTHTMSYMKDMGLNILRLGNMWTGWQPDNGESINSTYADILEASSVRNILSIITSPFINIIWFKLIY